MLKVGLILLAVFAILFLMTLVIYFFNLDMKMAALLIPLFKKHYDRVDRKKERMKEKEKKRKSI